jgi:NAD-dependent dihydropyrimidine dehydrogenase PreA subunit
MSEITYGPKIDYRLCIGCGNCYDECPMDVIGWNKDEQMPIVAYRSDCTCCSICETVCTQRAIDVHLPLHVRIDYGIFPEKTGCKKKDN